MNRALLKPNCCEKAEYMMAKYMMTVIFLLQFGVYTFKSMAVLALSFQRC